MRIGIDFDDVICNTMQGFLKYYNNILWEETLKFEDLIESDFTLIPKLQDKLHSSFDHFNNYFLSNDFINVEPLENAYEKLKLLKDWGNELFIVTARPLEWKDITLKRLDKFFPNMIDWVYFTGSYGTITAWRKSEICNQLWLNIFIDDNYMNCHDISQNCNIPVYMLSKSWNINKQLSPNIKRVDSWNLIYI